MKSDIKLKKIELAKNQNISQSLKIMYQINVNIKTIRFRIEVSESSNITLKVDSIEINTDKSSQLHKGRINNFSICFENFHRSSRENR